jgi:hypothetical protein
VDTCRRVGQKPLDVVQRGVTERKARGAAQLRVDIPQLSSSLALGSSTLALVGASTQSRRRSTVSGRMTSWYLLRLNVSRIKSATPQRKLTMSLWFMLVESPYRDTILS